MDLLRRILTILFLPIAIFIFMLGWSMQWIGEKQNQSITEKHQRETVAKDGTADKRVELEVIEDLMERVLKAE